MVQATSGHGLDGVTAATDLTVPQPPAVRSTTCARYTHLRGCFGQPGLPPCGSRSPGLSCPRA